MRVSCIHKFARVAYYKYPEAIEQILAKIPGIDTSRSYEKTSEETYWVISTQVSNGI